MATPSRSEKKLKRRKTNRILNTAIAVVLLLIVVVSFFIFGGGNDEEQVQTPAENASQQKSAQSQASDENENTEANQQDEEEANEEEADEEEKEDNGQEVVEESDEPNVDKEITNPDWDPVGTSQSGEHVSSFDSDSTDWNEKIQALSYATGIPVENMTVWYVSGNGPDGAIGTVSPKDNQNDAYRVYIQWVDGEGWKPEKVYKLKENDKGR